MLRQETFTPLDNYVMFEVCKGSHYVRNFIVFIFTLMFTYFFVHIQQVMYQNSNKDISAGTKKMKVPWAWILFSASIFTLILMFIFVLVVLIEGYNYSRCINDINDRFERQTP